MEKNITRILVAMAVATAAVLAVLSVRGQPDQPRIMRVTCENNLKMISLSLGIWESDHGDDFPWNVSTNAGGVKELIGADKDGFATNAWLAFQVMSNELRSPKVLLCPDDKRITPAMNFSRLAASNVTYRLHIIPDLTPGKAARLKIPLVVCPVDGDVVYYNGDVEVKK